MIFFEILLGGLFIAKDIMRSIKKSSEYREVYQEKRSKANHLLVLYKKKNDLSLTRYGISVSKKVGNSVVRHRLKRQLREIIRLSDLPVANGYDLVFVVRVAAAGVSYDKLLGSYENLMKRQGIIQV